MKEDPCMGVPLASKQDGLSTGIRFIVISRQLVFYDILQDTVCILRVLDGRTDHLSILF